MITKTLRKARRIGDDRLGQSTERQNEPLQIFVSLHAGSWGLPLRC